MKILITGARGYIGSAVLKKLGTQGKPAVPLSSRPDDAFTRLELEKVPAFDFNLVSEGDVVLFLAAISSPDICAKDPERVRRVNVTGSGEFIAECVRRGARIIFFSSDAVYGERDDEFDETMACNPAGDYALMKHELENKFIEDSSFKSIRLSYVFSTEDKFTRYLRGCAARGEEAEIFHPFYRSVIHRDDVVQGAVSLAQRWDEFPQNVINFGGPDIISRIEFTEALRNTALSTLRFRQIQPEPAFFANRPRVIRMKSPLLASLLGRPARSLHEAAQLEFDQ